MERKWRVAVVGATGMVGQRFVSLLADHPWFEIAVVAASARSAGKTYEEAVSDRWAFDWPIPQNVRPLVVRDASDVAAVTGEVDFVFCAVDMKKDEIRALEDAYAKSETPVVSNNSAHRGTPDVPMIVPELNPQHADVIEYQRRRLGTKVGFVTVLPWLYSSGYGGGNRAQGQVECVLGACFQFLRGAHVGGIDGSVGQRHHIADSFGCAAGQYDGFACRALRIQGYDDLLRCGGVGDTAVRQLAGGFRIHSFNDEACACQLVVADDTAAFQGELQLHQPVPEAQGDGGEAAVVSVGASGQQVGGGLQADVDGQGEACRQTACPVGVVGKEVHFAAVCGEVGCFGRFGGCHFCAASGGTHFVAVVKHFVGNFHASGGVHAKPYGIIGFPLPVHYASVSGIGYAGCQADGYGAIGHSFRFLFCAAASRQK